jgi:hypothetical protein
MWSQIDDESLLPIEKLLKRFTHASVAEHIRATRPQRAIYLHQEWFILDQKTNLWIQSENLHRLILDSIREDFKSYQTGLEQMVSETNTQESELVKKHKGIATLDKDDCRDSKQFQEYRRKESLIQFYEKRFKELESRKETYQDRLDRIESRLAKTENAGFCEGVTKMMKSLFERKNSELFNASRKILAFKDKVYDLKEGSVRDRRADDYITKTLEINYVERSKCLDIIKDILRRFF